MNLRAERSPLDGVVHADNIALLVAGKASTTYDQLQLAEPLFFPDGNGYSLLIDGPRLSRTTIVYNVAQKALLVIVQGVDQRWSQVPGIIASWYDTADSGGTGNIFAEAATTILNEIISFGVQFESVRVIGHSFGGCVAHWLGRYLRYLVPNDTGDIFIYTYGAPKADAGSSDYPAAAVSYRRVFALDDPVPALPPGPAEMGSVWVLTGIPTARRWERWRHRIQAYVLRANGVIGLTASSNGIEDPGFVFTLFSWLTGTTAFGSSNHSLAQYQVLCATIAPVIFPTPNPVAAPDTSAPPRLTGVAIQAARDTAVAIVATTVASSPEAAAVGIMTGVPRQPGVRFSGGRLNGVPYVFYGDTPILPTRTLRVRRAVVRRLNQTLPF